MNIETWFNTEEIKRFYFPGKIVEGTGAFEKSLGFLDDANLMVALVIDGHFVNDKKTSIIVERKNTKTKVIEGVPITQDVIEFYNEFPQAPDVIFAIGGGSVSDFAKALLAQYTYGEFESIGLQGRVVKPKQKKPDFISVPTTAASGAESSRYYVTYDRNDHHKVFGKNWDLVADWIFLDPYFLETIDNQSLVSGAFDIFVHLFESYVCRYESSISAEMISLDCIPRALVALEQAIVHGERSDSVHTTLLHCASFGGMAISNVRTGNIHEAAGALLEVTKLNHPETLFVFFRAVIEQYAVAIADKENKLIASCRRYEQLQTIASVLDLISWWENLFQQVGLDLKIKAAIQESVFSQDQIKKHIFDRVIADKVWSEKEGPITSDRISISDFIDKSFANYEFSN